jgi:hypothetical protein
MNLTATLALLGWPLISLLLFAFMRPRHAAIASIIVAWMFLPVAALKVSGIPLYNKAMATSLGTLLGIVCFDLRRLLAFRPGWKDLPMGIWCLCPFASSIWNDLGAHDGITAVLVQTTKWGLPYLFGRLYCTTLQGLAELAMGIFLGGLVYVPLCLFEVRMSPQLHTWVYGFYQHSFLQAIRYGGYRPTVFMEHGLMVAMWMAMATLVGTWMWISKLLKSLFGIPLPWFLVTLFATTLLCKSLGAVALLLGGLLVLGATRWGSPRLALIALALLAPLYLAMRIPKVWTGSELTQAASLASSDRASSLKFRIDNEEMLVARALRQPVFGWGGWGRARVRDETGRDISVTDSLWIIEIGDHGLVGLFAMTAAFLVPLAGLIGAVPRAAWRHPLAAPAVALCVMVLLYLVDCQFNNMDNPAYTLAVGGLTCLRIGLVKKPKPVVVQAKDVKWTAPSGT